MANLFLRLNTKMKLIRNSIRVVLLVGIVLMGWMVLPLAGAQNQTPEFIVVTTDVEAASAFTPTPKISDNIIAFRTDELTINQDINSDGRVHSRI